MGLASLTLSLLAAEVILRATTSPELYLDKRTDAYWRALERDSSAATREAADIALDPLLGWRMKPGFEQAFVHHNSLGFRGTREYVPSSQAPRILALGDSFTYGLGVPDQSTYSAWLERISGIEVINAGANGYGIDQSLLMWETEGKRLQPSIVILGYCVDDFFRNALSVREFPKPRFAFDAATQQYRLERPGGDDGRAASGASEAILAAHSRVVRAIGWLLREARVKLGIIDEEAMAQRARTSEYLLRRLHSSVIASGARLLVVVIGHGIDGQPELSWIEDSIMAACRSNEIECLDLQEARRGIDSTSFYIENGHFSEQGHRFAAQKIAQLLGLGR